MCGLALLSCRKESVSLELPDFISDRDAAVRLAPGYGGVELKSPAGLDEVLAEFPAVSGSEKLLLLENVTDMALPATKGIPVTTLNFAEQYSDGFRAFAVYSGKTDRSSDLAATFSKVSEEDVWTHVYNDIDWPLDNNLRYYFSAPATLPDYLDVVDSADATQSKDLTLRLGNGYPTDASSQKDLLFASQDITLVRGGTVSSEVNFYHIFAGVRVKQGNTGGKFAITGVTLTGMPVSGTCDLSFTSGSRSADCAIWSHPESTPATSDFTLTPSGVDAAFCVPKSFSAGDGSTMKITYTDNGGGPRTEDIDLGKLLDGQSWLAGQMYTYTITIADLGVTVTDVVETTGNRDVTVTNTGNVGGYIRAALAADWVKKVGADEESVVIRNCNLATEGTFTKFGKGGWIKVGEWYYYKYPVKAGFSAAEKLFDRYTAGTAPSPGAFLQFRIMAQIVPFEASKSSVTAAWGAAAAAPLSIIPETVTP